MRLGSRSVSKFAALLCTVWIILLLLHYLVIPALSESFRAGGVIEVYSVEGLKKYFEEGGAVLLMITKEGCPACQVVEPAFKKLSTEVTDVSFVKVHITPFILSDPGEAMKVLKSLGVPGTPTFMFLVDGEIIARHLGTFRGNQYEGLKEFIELSLFMGRRADNEVREDTSVEGRSLFQAIAVPATLGLISAFSPCSLPLMLTVATSAGRERTARKVWRSMLMQAASLAALTTAGGILLSLLYLSSGYVKVDLYTPVVLLAAALTLSWGLMNLAGSEPILRYSSRIRGLLPVLGLQCSLPFLVAALAYASREPLPALASALAFTAAYSIPYAVSLITGRAVGLKLRKYLSSRSGLLIQGIVLTSVSVYLAIETLV